MTNFYKWGSYPLKQAVEFTGGERYAGDGIITSGRSIYVQSGNGGKFTCSFWVYKIPNETSDVIRFSRTDDGDNFILAISVTWNTNLIGVVAYDKNRSYVLLSAHSTNGIADNAWTHVMVSVNLDAETCQMAVNGSVAAVTITEIHEVYPFYFELYTYVLEGYSTIGTGDDYSEMSLAELWFDDDSLDLTDSAVRAKFISGGKPVYLGQSGWKPTGTKPKLYQSGGGNDWLINRGNVTVQQFNFVNIPGSAIIDSTDEPVELP